VQLSTTPYIPREIRTEKMTHVSLHRCRFVDYPPSSITAIAFSHSSAPHSALPPPKTLRVAIGRNNGSIEIWNPLSGKWHHETTLQGGNDRSIEGLAWVQDYDEDGRGLLRLLSIGYSSEVTEWDLATGRPAKHLDCNGGVIWSLSVQPRRNATDVPEEEQDDDEAVAQKVVVGTDDGTLKLLSTAGGRGQLTFIKNLTRAGTSKSRVLSLVWKDRYTVVAGMADSTIRVWDIRSGRSIARMSLNRERGKEILVWAVKVTKNGDVVSGDSRGEVCFWNGSNWTLKQRMKAHEADCLTLEVGGQNGESVISGGADMRTVLYRIVGKGRGWGEVARRRFHKHDVRAMAAYESGGFSVVVSGGTVLLHFPEYY
jgi:U3 small nucleolar RNA-associated protein 4